MNAYGMQSGGSGMPPVPQNIFATYSSSSATSTGKLLAQQRLASLLYPGEQSLSKFGWADRVKEYLAEIKLSREERLPAGSAKIIARDDPQERLAGVDESSAACSHPSEQSDPPPTAGTRQGQHGGAARMVAVLPRGLFRVAPLPWL